MRKMLFTLSLLCTAPLLASPPQNLTDIQQVEAKSGHHHHHHHHHHDCRSGPTGPVGPTGPAEFAALGTFSDIGGQTVAGGNYVRFNTASYPTLNITQSTSSTLVLDLPGVYSVSYGVSPIAGQPTSTFELEVNGVLDPLTQIQAFLSGESATNVLIDATVLVNVADAGSTLRVFNSGPTVTLGTNSGASYIEAYLTAIRIDSPLP